MVGTETHVALASFGARCPVFAACIQIEMRSARIGYLSRFTEFLFGGLRRGAVWYPSSMRSCGPADAPLKWSGREDGRRVVPASTGNWRRRAPEIFFRDGLSSPEKSVFDDMTGCRAGDRIRTMPGASSRCDHRYGPSLGSSGEIIRANGAAFKTGAVS